MKERVGCLRYSEKIKLSLTREREGGRERGGNKIKKTYKRD